MSESKSNDAPVDEIIRQGKHRLSILQHQLLAAQLAADSVNLQTAIQQAECGNPEPLQNWLEMHDASGASLPPRTLNATPSLAQTDTRPHLSGSKNPSTMTGVTSAASMPLASEPASAAKTSLEPISSQTANSRQTVEADENASQPLHSPKLLRPSDPVDVSSQTSCEQAAAIRSADIDPSQIHPLWRSMVAGALKRQAENQPDRTNGSDAPAKAKLQTNVAAKQNDLDRKRDKPKSPKSGRTRESAKANKKATDAQTPAKPRKPLIAKSDLPSAAEQVAAQQKSSWLRWLPSHLPIIGKRQKTPSWVVSLVVHVVILLALMCFTLDSEQIKNVLAINASPGSVEEPSFELPMEMPLEPTPDVSEMQTPDMALSTDAISTTNFESSISDLLSDIGAVAAPGDSNIPNFASGGGAPNIPSPQANFFGVEATGNTFGYLVDNSPSMKRDNAFASAKAELIRSLSQLKSNQRFYVIFFSDTVEPLTLDQKLGPEDYPIYATPENLEATKRWIDSVPVSSNGAPPNDALEYAINLDLDAAYMLTDGVTSADVCGFLRDENFVDDFINGKQLRTAIHTLGFFSQKGEPLLKQIAKENGGQYLYIPKPKK